MPAKVQKKPAQQQKAQKKPQEHQLAMKMVKMTAAQRKAQKKQDMQPATLDAKRHPGPSTYSKVWQGFYVGPFSGKWSLTDITVSRNAKNLLQVTEKWACE